nr:hypothetical protein [Cellulomonas uda]
MGVQAIDLLVELASEQALGLLLVGDGVVHEVADEVDVDLGEALAAVVPLDGVFDGCHLVVWLGAGAVASVGAEVVEVLGAVAVEHPLDAQPLVFAAYSLALAAVDGAFEEVVVDPASFAGLAARLHDVLDGVEQVLVDEGFVPAGVLLALVGHDADVVAVLEHLVEFVDRDGSGGTAGGRPRQEATVGELIGQVVQRVLARGVQLEGEPHVGRSLFVDCDGADLTALVVVDDVLVAELGDADRAAALGLLAHLVGDVRAGFAGLVLVEDREHALHELPDRCLVDRLGGRHQGDPELGQVDPHESLVVAVAR